MTRILRHAGVGTIVGCDRQGAVYSGRPGLDGIKAEYAEETNPEPGERLGGRGARGARTCTSACRSRVRCPSTAIRAMAKDAIVFAMANPTPGGGARGARRARRRRRDRPVGLPEPDQQRARLPRRLPRGAGRARARHHRGDEARGGRGDRGRDRRRTSSGRSTSSRASSTARSCAWSPPRSPKRRSATASRAGGTRSDARARARCGQLRQRAADPRTPGRSAARSRRARSGRTLRGARDRLTGRETPSQPDVRRASRPPAGSVRCAGARGPRRRGRAPIRCSFSTSAKRDEALAAGAEPDSRADGDVRLPRQLDGELERAELAVGLRDRRPDEHRPERPLDVPADALEPAQRTSRRLR